MRTISVFTALLLGTWLSAAPASVSAAPKAAAKSVTAKKGAKKSKARHAVFSGYQVPEARLRGNPLPRPSGKLVMTSVNEAGARVEVNIYNPDGSFNDDALDTLNHFWRCRRTGTEKAIDPHLFEVLSHIYDRFGKPLELVSGFRNQKRTTSFHFVGSASDVRITGVSERNLKDYVEELDTGGMGIGIYPHGHFIHVDVRPEPSYRWVDYSPPGSSDMGQPKDRKRSPNS